MLQLDSSTGTQPLAGCFHSPSKIVFFFLNYQVNRVNAFA